MQGRLAKQEMAKAQRRFRPKTQVTVKIDGAQHSFTMAQGSVCVDAALEKHL